MHQSTQTSINAYANQKKSGKLISDKDMIYAFLLNNEPMTRRELCDALNNRDKSFTCYDKILYETVVGRCNGLINEGFISVVGVRNNREILKANVNPIPYIPPFKWNKENVATLLHRTTGRSKENCMLLVDEFVRNYK